MRLKSLVAGAMFLMFAIQPVFSDGAKKTMRGWFVDEKCTRERVAQGRIEPDNPECARQCVKDGSKLMFMSETDKDLFEVADPKPQLENIGYYVEVSGTADPQTKALNVADVKKLDELNASCERPTKKK